MIDFTKGIWIYPTDTIYGIGCNALNEELVERIRIIKGRDNKPLSVIAPSKDWIKENCEVEDKYLDLLPGPYTLLCKKKDSNFLNHVANGELLGVRIPDNEFCLEIDVPFITTSVNKAGEPPATFVEDIDRAILASVDEIVNIGPLKGNPSTLINTISGEKTNRSK